MSRSDTDNLGTGVRFGNYVIVRRLGKGAYGSVYEALRQPLNRRVALKVLHPQMASQERIVARFIQEAELVASLEHPHIVGVFDVGVDEDVPYLAMEFLEGQSLGDHLKHNVALSVADTVDLLLPILSAVATVHDRGVVHRDLKPDNIMLARSATGEIVSKLLDFGIAKVTTTDHALTNTNAFMGTPSYMSPEQARESKHVDARADQWALGVIAWQCVAGRRPFRGNSLLDVLNAVAHGPIEPLRLIVPQTPAAFEQAILGALQRDPASRYPTVWDFGWRLLPFASPMAQAKWRDHFAANITVATQAQRSDLAPAHPTTTTPAPPRPAPAPVADPAAHMNASVVLTTSLAQQATSTSAGTLEPRAMTVPGSQDAPRATAWIAGSVVGAAVLLGLGIAIGARSTPAPTTHSAGQTSAPAPAPAPQTVSPAAPIVPAPQRPAPTEPPMAAQHAAPQAVPPPAVPPPRAAAAAARAPAAPGGRRSRREAVAASPRSGRVAGPTAPAVVLPAQPASPPPSGARRGDDII